MTEESNLLMVLFKNKYAIHPWKRNCKVYLASLKNHGSKSTSTLGTLTIYVMDILIADSFVNS
jgi:hypothetical protein